jgi:hypothetical protein
MRPIKLTKHLFGVLTLLAGALLLSLTPALGDHDKGKGKGHEDVDDDDDGQGPSSRNSFRAEMWGGEEVPPVSTDGQGLLRLKIDGNTIEYELEYRNLKGGTPTAAHLHFGQKGVNGGVIAFLCGGSKPACPAPGARMTGMLQGSDVVGPLAQGIGANDWAGALKALRHGLVYANAHNAAFPNGEIRGQVR